MTLLSETDAVRRTKHYTGLSKGAKAAVDTILDRFGKISIDDLDREITKAAKANNVKSTDIEKFFDKVFFESIEETLEEASAILETKAARQRVLSDLRTRISS